MREYVSRKKQTSTGFSIPSLKHPTRGFGLESSAISRQAVPEIQPLQKPVTHDISHIPLRTQAKLSISQPGDIYEQEADSVAQQVMQRMAQPVNGQSIQREVLPEEEEELQMKPLANSITPLVQREEMPEHEEELQMKSLDSSTLQREEVPEDEEELQMKSLDISTLQREALPEDEEELQMKPMVQRQAKAGMAAAPDLEASISQARGGGQAIADNIRKPMEQAFGADFSRVKVHTDGQSDQLNQSIQARAFTTGQDVFFRQGEYNPGSRGGQELLAHELTHVVQQNGGAVQRSPKPQERVGQLPTGKTESLVAGDGVIQRYIEISKFFLLLDRLKLENNLRHRLMHWNSVGVFDEVQDNEEKLKEKMLEFLNISENVGGGELKPGQKHKDDSLPGWLNYFSEFKTPLPNNWGELSFKKGFDRLTAHGWISDNVVLPKEEFPKGVAVHVILAVSETNSSSEKVVINPHVTVRVKAVQDKYDQIALINDQKAMTNENKNIGLEGTKNSLSIGIKTDREKADTNASQNIGKPMEDLKKGFTTDWLKEIVDNAWKAAQSDQAVKPTKEFSIK
ncbi:eCIS core domain-containing protein [Nostoc sp.]|uniref:eCIS core domain-containing protein n=1 Tax=Nostoc sp. TaxID=1180 RepID=UPI002FFA4125